MPKELPSVEGMLKKLVAALCALETPVLDKSEVSRLRGIIAGVNSYQGLLADYMDYRGLEAELMELRKKYEQLASKGLGVS
jgi:hypothetical protein